MSAVRSSATDRVVVGKSNAKLGKVRKAFGMSSLIGIMLPYRVRRKGDASPLAVLRLRGKYQSNGTYTCEA